MALVFAPNEIPLRRAKSDAMTEIAKEEPSFVRGLHGLISQEFQFAVNYASRHCLPIAIRSARTHCDTNDDGGWETLNGDRFEPQLRVEVGSLPMTCLGPVKASDIATQDLFSRSSINERQSGCLTKVFVSANQNISNLRKSNNSLLADSGGAFGGRLIDWLLGKAGECIHFRPYLIECARSRGFVCSRPWIPALRQRVVV